MNFLQERHQHPLIQYCPNATSAFILACCCGDLQLAKWLIELWPEIIYRADNDAAFRLTCKNGHLDVAKWLKENWPDINHRAFDDWAFIIACQYGHLAIAKWLKNQWPDIDHRGDGDLAFRLACEYGHLPVAHWLKSSWPDIDNSTGNRYILDRINANNETEWTSLLPYYNEEQQLSLINVSLINSYDSATKYLIRYYNLYQLDVEPSNAAKYDGLMTQVQSAFLATKSANKN